MLTHGLKTPGFNPRAYEVKDWKTGFKVFFRIQRVPLHRGAPATPAAGRALQLDMLRRGGAAVYKLNPASWSVLCLCITLGACALVHFS
jgi:hypothetical protein